MRGFKLTQAGDVEIRNNKIEMLSDDELTMQTIEYLLSTNKGECFYNEEEGINFRNLLGKNIEDDAVKSEILGGLMQLSPDYVITNFEAEHDSKTRNLKVSFKAESANGEVVNLETGW